ncbi:MAG: putative toxin-antitoxin system toxin component, PIN family [Sphingobium sp.]
MRIVVDTNVFVSALLSSRSLPAQLVTLWRQGHFCLLTSVDQIEELRRVTRYPKIRARLSPTLAGRLINELRAVATVLEDLPEVTVCRDPWDNFLLATIEAGSANMLVTGDKADLLSLERHAGARIVTVRRFLELTGKASQNES